MQRWLISLLSWLGRIKKPQFHARYADKHPSIADLAADDLVIVRSGLYTKWACFRCPCGCGEKIALSLDKDRRPSWRVSADWLRRPTIDPSVRQLDRCFSHFWIKGGQVHWCPDSGRRSQQPQ
jgi:Family of unknown function (DUF6527)